MKGRAFQAVFLDPVGGPGENVVPVVIEPQNERAVHLDAVLMQHADPARIVAGLWCFLPCIGEILIRE